MSLFEEKLALVSRSSVLLDTNLQVLEVVGNVRPDWIGKHGRTDHFSIAHYETLARLLGRSRSRITTPHILAETSGLLNLNSRGYANQYREEFARQIKLLHEKYVEAVSIVENPAFESFGLTDVGMLCLDVPDLVVISVDRDLCTQLAIRRIEAINLYHLMES